MPVSPGFRYFPRAPSRIEKRSHEIIMTASASTGNGCDRRAAPESSTANRSLAPLPQPPVALTVPPFLESIVASFAQGLDVELCNPIPRKIFLLDK